MDNRSTTWATLIYFTGWAIILQMMGVHNLLAFFYSIQKFEFQMALQVAPDAASEHCSHVIQKWRVMESSVCQHCNTHTVVLQWKHMSDVFNVVAIEIKNCLTVCLAVWGVHSSAFSKWKLSGPGLISGRTEGRVGEFLWRRGVSTSTVLSDTDSTESHFW